ncbi:Uncharacterised protein g11001 [Pycnogonum litorale]
MHCFMFIFRFRLDVWVPLSRIAQATAREHSAADFHDDDSDVLVAGETIRSIGSTNTDRSM